MKKFVSETEKRLADLLSKKIMIIDGATGSYIRQKYDKLLTEEFYRGTEFKDSKIDIIGNNDVLSITQKQVIRGIHEDYLKAGSDFVTTNTFSATVVEQSKYGLTKEDVYKMNFNSASIAREECDKYSTKEKPRFVLGSVGPLSKTLSVGTDVDDPSKREVTFDEVRESYKHQIEALVRGGADVVLIETIFDVLNAKAAIAAALDFFEEDPEKNSRPIGLSASLEKSGRTLSGHTVKAYLSCVQHAKPLFVGLNCSRGALALSPYLIEIARDRPNLYISCYPNAGIPDQNGHYTHTPEIMAREITKLANSQCINLVGGCCGSTPAHIKEIAESLHPSKIGETFKLRKLSEIKPDLDVAGLEKMVRIEGSLINVGERCNAAGSAIFKKVLRTRNFRRVVDIARGQANTGANIIDICVDDPLLEDKQEVMRTAVRYLSSDPKVASLPIMVDSSDFDTLVEGIKNTPGKPIINSLSLKVGKEKFLKEAKELYKLGCNLLIMAFDSEGQATTAEQKIRFCKNAYDILLENTGFTGNDLVFDPCIMSIGTGIEEHNNYGVEVIKGIEGIKRECAGSFTSAGVSNLSFSFRGQNAIREGMHSIFLKYATEKGLDMGIVNPGKLPSIATLPDDLVDLLTSLILNKSPNATTDVLKWIQSHKGFKTQTKIEKKDMTKYTLQKQLELCLVNGEMKEAERVIDDLLKKEKRDPLDIINIDIFKGLDAVGYLFASGKLFLPQVIQSARIVKNCIDQLKPYLPLNDQDQEIDQFHLLMCTVEGDVHDIGKNIVNCVLQCSGGSGLKITDLGVMVKMEQILDFLKKNKVNLLGMSALITPSLAVIERNLEILKNEGYEDNLPVLVGGACTSFQHTALYLSPKYRNVIYVKDAAESVTVLDHLQGSYAKTFLDNTRKSYEDARIAKKQIKIQEFMKKTNFDKKNLSEIVKPKDLSEKIKEYEIKDFEKFIDWRYFYAALGKWSKNDESADPVLKKAKEEAMKLLEKYGSKLKGKVMYKLLPAKKNGDNIILFNDEKEYEYTFFRQEQTDGLCISDFVHDNDYVGVYIGSIFGRENVELTETESIYFDLVCDRLAEALAEYVHLNIRQNEWGYEKKGECNCEDVIEGRFVGIRPAIGYPSIPNHHLKNTLWKMLNVEEKLGVKLTESTMMVPKSSTCCLIFQRGVYYDLGIISEKSVKDYCEKNGVQEKVVIREMRNNIQS